MPGPQDTATDTTNGAAPAADTTNGAAPAAGADTTAALPEGGAAAGAGARTPTDALPPEALAFRLRQEAERAQKKLLDRYGAASPEELEAKLKRFAALEESEKKRAAEDEEKKRSSMSNEEKLRSDNAALTARVAELESQLAAERGRVSGLRQGQVIRAQAADLIDPDLVDEAQAALAMHIRALKDAGDEAKLKEFERPGKVREWFRDLTARKPKFAKAAAPAETTAAPAAKPGVAKRPLTNGAPPKVVVPPAKQTPGQQSAKTLRPGRGNSMNDDEARKHVAEKYPGVRVPGLTS